MVCITNHYKDSLFHSDTHVFDSSFMVKLHTITPQNDHDVDLCNCIALVMQLHCKVRAGAMLNYFHSGKSCQKWHKNTHQDSYKIGMMRLEAIKNAY